MEKLSLLGLINSTESGYRTKVISPILVLLLIIYSAFSAIVANNDVSNISLQLAYAQTFGEPIQITDLQGDQTDPHIASSGDNVYLVMTSEVGGTSDILFTRSTDGGTSFSDLFPINEEGPFSFLSDIASEGDNVYVVWTSVTDQSEILLSKSTDGGLSFGDPIEVTGVAAEGVTARFPRVAVSGDNVYVAWQDFRESPSVIDSEIFFAVSTDGALTFSDPVNISNTQETLSRSPAIAAYGDNVYVVWADGAVTGADSRTLFTKSTDEGVSFSTPVELKEPEARLPDIAAYGDNVYVTWGQDVPGPEPGTRDRQIFLVTSTDQGDNFDEPVNISNNPVGTSIAQNPNTYADGNNVAITWEQRDLTATDPNWDVLFSGSTDNGITFSSPIDISESDVSGSLNQVLNDITLSGDNAYVTWTALDSSFDVYFVSGVLQEVISPPEQIQDLIDTINSFTDISKGTKNSLVGPLRGAIELLTDDNPNNDNAVCNMLNAFLNQVDSKENNGQISTAQANELREKAQAIQTSLECSSAPQLSTSSPPSDSDPSSPSGSVEFFTKNEGNYCGDPDMENDPRCKDGEPVNGLEEECDEICEGQSRFIEDEDRLREDIREAQGAAEEENNEGENEEDNSGGDEDNSDGGEDSSADGGH